MKELGGERFNPGKREIAASREVSREDVTAETDTNSSTTSICCGSVDIYFVVAVTRLVPFSATARIGFAAILNQERRYR
jgi:hypothetical protein